VFYGLKNTFVTPLHLLFLFTNKRAVLLSAQTDQSQFSFPAGFQHEIEHALAPEKCDRLTSFWYQLTDTRNRCLMLAGVSSLLDICGLRIGLENLSWGFWKVLHFCQ